MKLDEIKRFAEQSVKAKKSGIISCYKTKEDKMEIQVTYDLFKKIMVGNNPKIKQTYYGYEFKIKQNNVEIFGYCEFYEI